MTQNNPFDIAISQMTYQLMQPMLHDHFQLINGQSITLVEVRKITQNQHTPSYSWQKPKTETPSDIDQCQAFSLVFRFPMEYPVTQGMMQISHPEKGTFEGMFLTPITQDEDGIYFEAVFSQHNT